MKKAIFIFIGFMVCAYIGCNIGPSYKEVKAYTETQEYKAAERAHMAKWGKF